MSGATSLALPRRLLDPRYAEAWFVGRGLDIGCGPDPLAGYSWPHAAIRNWDMEDGDATTLPGLAAESFDFVYSSHCLEHLDDPHAALARWWDVLKPGGHLIVVVPDFEMYERHIWPSRIQPEGHKHNFSPFSLLHVLNRCCSSNDPYLDVIRLERLVDGFNPALPVTVDQTTPPYNAECGIEAIVRKPT